MYICYIDESGTSSIPGNTSHFVLAGISVPIENWKTCDIEITTIKRRYGLEESEIHTAWLLRRYLEQTKIKDFSSLDYSQRRSSVMAYRNLELLRLQRVKNPYLYKQTKKNYRQTEGYIHLTYDERKSFLREIAATISRWTFARLFAECIDKIHFDPLRAKKTTDEQSFEQIVSRFERFLQNMSKGQASNECGLLIADNNETVARNHITLMKKFHRDGTLWTQVKCIIEMPLFVDSELTDMVQLADVCAYSLRRYLENGDEELFNYIFRLADKIGNDVVGVRHFTRLDCRCRICQAHPKVT